MGVGGTGAPYLTAETGRGCLAAPTPGRWLEQPPWSGGRRHSKRRPLQSGPEAGRAGGRKGRPGTCPNVPSPLRDGTCLPHHLLVARGGPGGLVSIKCCLAYKAVCTVPSNSGRSPWCSWHMEFAASGFSNLQVRRGAERKTRDGPAPPSTASEEVEQGRSAAEGATGSHAQGGAVGARTAVLNTQITRYLLCKEARQRPPTGAVSPPS